MQIIKDKQIADDTWIAITDDAELKTGDISVSLARWKKDKAILLGHNGNIGVRIGPADSIEAIAADLDHIQLIELDFPDFADGRSFSHAWLLRGRHHYRGEIRAIGHYMPDQVFYLSRVGVNAFKPEKDEHIPAIIGHLNDFTVSYQPSIN